jgi:GNAT superfamily N-acetyltransferase
MPSVEVRPFRRADRQQLTALVNAHIATVVPGWSVSVNAVLSQFEREPDEGIVDPWVVDRAAFVAIEREQVVAGALLLRYADEPRVSDSYRGTGEIRWLACRPGCAEAGDALAAVCVAELAAWGVRRQHADGAMPAPAIYGVPDCWPHVRDIYRRAGFEHHGRTEVILVATVGALPQPPQIAGLELRRDLGALSTRLSAFLDGEPIGLVEISTDITGGGARSRLAGWGEVDNLHVAEAHRRRGIGTWLVGHAADWLRLARVERVIAYASPDDAELAFLRATGWRELARTDRGWTRTG